MRPRDLESALHRLRAEEINFTMFVHETRQVWEALAQYLLKRWRAPSSVAPDDLVQELLVACWRFAYEWDASRGVAISRYIVYNCTDKAKKWLHKRRGAHRRDDKSPSRFELPFSSLVKEGQEEDRAEASLLDRVAIDATQETEMMRIQAVRSVKSSDLPFMIYQQTGDIEQAAARLMTSSAARVVFHVDSLDTARAVVERSIEVAAAQVA